MNQTERLSLPGSSAALLHLQLNVGVLASWVCVCPALTALGGQPFSQHAGGMCLFRTPRLLLGMWGDHVSF